MAGKLPSIIVTGASGIVGKNFVEAARDDFFIYAIARRSQKEAGIAEHPNIKWLQVDIANWLSLRWVMHNIKHSGGADYVLHLAGYYDFEYTDNPEYERTNVKGTRYILEQSKILRIKRLVFASSIAACNFPLPGRSIDEKTPVEANYHYAVSKRKGEEMVREFSRWFPCSIVRFAAVFTDWCEYGVLYMFLSTWLSGKWNAQVLGGKGESAVPYIHAKDLCKLLLTIFKNSDKLPQLDTYVASPDGSTSHRELFDLSTRFYYGRKKKAICMPKFLALPGVIALDLLGRLVGKRPFERPWMLKYLDYRLDTDSSYTRTALSWGPTPRYHIARRILFLVEKMKSDPLEWHRKNTTAMKRISLRPNLLIYEAMLRLKDDLTGEIKQTLLDPSRDCEFGHFRQDKKGMDWFVNIIFQLLGSAVRTNDRMLLLDYTRDLSISRFQEGFTGREIGESLRLMGKIIGTRLLADPELKGMGQDIHDYISMTMQLAMDEVDDTFEEFNKQVTISEKMAVQTIESQINQLESFYQSPGAEAQEDLLQ